MSINTCVNQTYLFVKYGMNRTVKLNTNNDGWTITDLILVDGVLNVKLKKQYKTATITLDTLIMFNEFEYIKRGTRRRFVLKTGVIERELMLI